MNENYVIIDGKVIISDNKLEIRDYKNIDSDRIIEILKSENEEELLTKKLNLSKQKLSRLLEILTELKDKNKNLKEKSSIKQKYSSLISLLQLFPLAMLICILVFAFISYGGFGLLSLLNSVKFLLPCFLLSFILLGGALLSLDLVKNFRVAKDLAIDLEINEKEIAECNKQIDIQKTKIRVLENILTKAQTKLKENEAGITLSKEKTESLTSFNDQRKALLSELYSILEYYKGHEEEIKKSYIDGTLEEKLADEEQIKLVRVIVESELNNN